MVGELNGQEVKLVKFQGTFVWHRHETEDELFLGIRGRFRLEFRDRAVEIGPGEFIIVPVESSTAPLQRKRSKSSYSSPLALTTRGMSRIPPSRRPRESASELLLGLAGRSC